MFRTSMTEGLVRVVSPILAKFLKGAVAIRAIAGSSNLLVKLVSGDNLRDALPLYADEPSIFVAVSLQIGDVLP